MKTRKVDVEIKDQTSGDIIFYKSGFEVPEAWSDRAATIVASKYAFSNENSALSVLTRVVSTIERWGLEQGYFSSDMEASNFSDDLFYALVDQRVAFNSPVYMNLGNNVQEQVSACYILSLEDTLCDILEYSKKIGMIFKNGSGVGVNASKLRGNGENLSNKGKSSGVCSFMKIWDIVGGAIKSGGRTRRSAAMVILEADHPDIEEFIECKYKEDQKAKILIKNGISPEEAIATVAYQNANHSVRVSDKFMKAVENDLDWDLINRGDGKVSKTIKARKLFNKIAEIAWHTGDPGIQFNDRMNEDNPVPSLGPLRATNPCFVGSMRLLTDQGYIKFRDLVGKDFDVYSPVDGKFRSSKVWSNGYKNAIKINFSKTNISPILCTEDHVFMTVDGEKLEAKDLVNKKIMPSFKPKKFGNSVDKLFLRYFNPASNSYDYAALQYYFGNYKNYKDVDDLACVLFTTNGFVNSDGLHFYYKDPFFGPVFYDFLRDKYGIDSFFNTVEESIDIYKWEDIIKFFENINFLKAHQRKSLLGYLLKITPKVDSIEVEGVREVFDFVEPKYHWGVVENFVAHNCSELSAVDNSSCNLASLNLIKYWSGENFDWAAFKKDVQLLVLSQDIMIDKAFYPIEQIKERTIETRPIGIGYTNLGGLLVSMGVAYGSKAAIDFVSNLTKKMTTYACEMSISLSEKYGSFKAFFGNEEAVAGVYGKLTESSEIHELIKRFGVRNSQLTLLAPTGTIAMMMDCDTTGIEPYFSLETVKTLAGGGVMLLPASLVEKKLKEKGFNPLRGSMQEFIKKLPDTSVYKTANEIPWREHIEMMAAAQKHLNGSISKTVNFTSTCTVQDIESAYYYAWQLGIKALAVYRDGSKCLQPLTSKNVKEDINDKISEKEDKVVAVRRKLPDVSESIRHKFCIGGFKGYFHISLYKDGSVGEVFISASKAGSTMRGLLDSYATAISYALQYGVPLEKLAECFKDVKFEPAGLTQDKDIRMCSSIIDYLFRWLELKFLDKKNKIVQSEDNTKSFEDNFSLSGPPCFSCGGMTQKSGTCFVCFVCGSSTGCAG